MKRQWISTLVAVTALSTSTVQASPELAKAACGRCHDFEIEKKGPTYKAMAAKYKDDEQAAMKAIYDPKAEHPKVKAKKDDVIAIVRWMMTQK